MYYFPRRRSEIKHLALLRLLGVMNSHDPRRTICSDNAAKEIGEGIVVQHRHAMHLRLIPPPYSLSDQSQNKTDSPPMCGA